MTRPLTRRRFIALSAAALAAPQGASAETWRGIAMGAQAEITLSGPGPQVRAALAEVRGLIRAVEAAFNLHDPASELSRLNARGHLSPSPLFAALIAWTSRLHAATGGLFDPSVQPLWRARFEGRAGEAEAVGWQRVQTGPEIRLAPGQALTFNGIAQGYATDLAAQALKARGFREVLVNIGEFAALGSGWHIGIADPAHGLLAQRRLSDSALATSSPAAMPMTGGHILGPGGQAPRWSTVSVEAESATLADGLSTALCLAGERQIARIRARLSGVRRVVVVDGDGSLKTL
ncbi:FAD:protein FMN transferase [Vannielia litorea]|uniref:FAD:protein FMN transferase n=1 Tax=Vannielia litorea TaxID=1217970 RepID=UPI001BCD75E3|nr:FAD:protein FMN transferase [Vannielia litorea]MBS8225139.1 FAD:protein FMN transferase [Vannielia litorea]